MVKKMTIVYLVIVALIVSVGGGLVYFKTKTDQIKQPVINQPTNSQELTIPGSTANVAPAGKNDCTDELDVTCWNAYSNEEFGIRFKFPNRWVVVKDKLVKGKGRDFLYVNFDTGIKIIKDNEPVIASLDIRSPLNDDSINIEDYYEQLVENTNDPNFKIPMNDGGFAVVEGCGGAYGCWLIKLGQNIFDFSYDIDLHYNIDLSEPTEWYISNNNLNMIKGKLKTIVKTVDSL